MPPTLPRVDRASRPFETFPEQNAGTSVDLEKFCAVLMWENKPAEREWLAKGSAGRELRLAAVGSPAGFICKMGSLSYLMALGLALWVGEAQYQRRLLAPDSQNLYSEDGRQMEPSGVSYGEETIGKSVTQIHLPSPL